MSLNVFCVLLDIDECPGSCHVNATCQNTPGAFNCECVNGLTGTGQSCDGKKLGPRYTVSCSCAWRLYNNS